jgi:hypothetical protein
MPEQKPGKRSIFADLLRSVHIDIARNEMIVTQKTGVLRRVESILHRHTLQPADWNDETALINLLRVALIGCKAAHSNVFVTLDDALVRMWMVTPPKNAGSLADCQASATLRFQALFGESAQDWCISADYDAYRPFLACAAPRSLVDRLHAVCAEFKLILQRVEPHFVITWNRYRKQIQPDAWLATLNNDTLALGVIDHGRLLAVRTLSIPYEIYHSKAWLDQTLQREGLLFNLSPPKKLQVVGVMPPQWQKNEPDHVHCTTPGGMGKDADLVLTEKIKSRAA